MQTPFDRALSFVLAREGGLSSDPKDRAANLVIAGTVHTAYGITQAAYTDWRLKKGDLPRPIAQIEQAEVAGVYFSDYWRAAWCDQIAQLPAPELALCLFDGAVQHGVHDAVAMLQRVVKVFPDGVAGPQTVHGCKMRIDGIGQAGVCSAYLERRHGLYVSLMQRDPSQVRFRRGWRNRLNALCEAVGITPVWPDDPPLAA